MAASSQQSGKVEILRAVASQLIQQSTSSTSFTSMESNGNRVVSVQSAVGSLKEGVTDDKESLLPNNANGSINGEQGQPSQEGSVSIKLFTLNVWGLKFVSKNRKERFKAIAEFLNRSDYDVVFMQELWLDEDFNEMNDRIKSVFAYSHFFDSGIIGSGTCIFSKYRLREANFHEFSINGYPTNFWHGDWFAAKGIGVCQIDYQGFDIHLYISHYHANYHPNHDIYLSHRVSHAFESAQWIKLASSAADLTIYAGDFNTEPNSLPYQILREVAQISDCWEDTHDSEEGGQTSEAGYNSYTVPSAANANGKGHRIDYVMYGPGPNVTAKTQPQSCRLPLPRRIPGKDFSYSDHEGVEAVIEMARLRPPPSNTTHNTAVEFRHQVSLREPARRLQVIGQAIDVMHRAHRATHRHGMRYGVYAMILLLLLALTFIPSFVIQCPGVTSWIMPVVDVSLFLPRFALTVGIVLFFLMATLFSKKQQNSVITCKKHLQMVYDDCQQKCQTK